MTIPVTQDDYTNLGLITPFDEGQKVYVSQRNAINSVGVDTRAFDSFRQGISMTMPSHYLTSTAKIHSGEEGHKILCAEYGINKRSRLIEAGYFQEIDNFNPEWFISCQTEISSSEELLAAFTYPIVISDSDQKFLNMNGVIEPLSIQSVISFLSIDSPYESHDIRGSFGSGNENMLFGTEQITNIYNILQGFSETSYLDVVDTFNARPTNGYFIYDEKPIPPFNDMNKSNGVKFSENATQDVKNALIVCNPNTDSYLNEKELSMNAGFTYGNCNQIGTDSIAFGDMLYCERNQLSSSFVYELPIA